MNQLLIIFIITLNSIYSCIKSESTEKDIIECINNIKSISDIKEKYISECSNMTKEEKWYGYLCLCRINGIKGNFELAKKMCLKAKEKKPFSYDVANEIAHLYMINNRIDEALIEANFAYGISSQNITTNLILAQIYEKKELFDKAYTHYEKCIYLIKKEPEKLIGKKTFIENKLKELKHKIQKQKDLKKEKLFSKCISQYRSIKENDKALQKLNECLTIKKEKNIKLYIEYLNLLYVNEKYYEFIENAIPTLNKINDNKQKNNIYLKLAKSYRYINNNKKAIEYYKKILTSLDINELINYAELLEEENDKINALEIYKKIYQQTNDIKINEKIEDLQTLLKSNDEIIKEMKERGFIEKQKIILSPDDRKKYLTIKYLEKKGGIDWIKTNYPGYANLTTKIDDKEVFLIEGYNLFLRKLSQDMIKILEKNKVSPHYIFNMLDENGNPIFDNKGYLTYEGIIAYYKTKEIGQKTWFYKTEVEAMQKNKKKDDKVDEIIKNLIKSGYEEITENEYIFLAKKTTCPDNILLSYPCNIKKIRYEDKHKYFICSSLKCVEDEFYTPIKLFSYIVSYREGKIKDDSNAISNFFGSGARKKRFCENGKIWKGPEFLDETKRKEELQKELDMIKNHHEKMKKVIKKYSPQPK